MEGGGRGGKGERRRRREGRNRRREGMKEVWGGEETSRRWGRSKWERQVLSLKKEETYFKYLIKT